MRRAARRLQPALRDNLVLQSFLCRQFGYEEPGLMLESLRSVGGQFDTGHEDAYFEALEGDRRARVPRRVAADALYRYRLNLGALSERLRMTAVHGRTWKPHQFLALLFAERFLERYFDDPDGLCRDLNRWRRAGMFRGVPDYREEDLRVLAIQSATGSGKTLLMHANILQYRHYLDLAGGQLNNIVLLTPNERMSEQHEREFRVSGLRARRLSPDAPSDLFGLVEIVDINKLAEKKGVKRVAVAYFGSDNLVLVDEGHLGASGKIWRQRRAELARGGFTIEYSATFTQVTRKHDDLRETYSKSLLFDYGYRQFHSDGYGKDYTISNLPRGMADENSDMYLLGCLLTFHQQSLLYRQNGARWSRFNLKKPLWVFLGKTVIGSSRADRETRSDVVRILDFLGWFLARREAVTEMLGKLLSGRSGLTHPVGGGDYFAGRFPYLSGRQTDALYDEICETSFHGTGRLRVVYLTTGEGELHLRIADRAPFGVVNVGDSAGLHKLLTERENEDYDLERNAGFAARLFHTVDRPDSTVTIVVGARRFIAGWNSWRVSAMGLMHVGVGEGPEIIQMFGRGVRLMGWKQTLKRHRESGAPNAEEEVGLSELETLHIFGLRANYMEAFEQILREEGVTVEPVPLPVTWNFAKKTDLKLIRLRKDLDYARSPDRVRLPGPGEPGRPHVELDRYSQLQATASVGLPPEGEEAEEGEWPALPREKMRVLLAPENSAFFSRDRIHDALLTRKRQLGWDNLVIERQTVDALLDDNDWYDLWIPPEGLRARGLDRVRELERMAVTLLSDYADEFWRRKRRAWDHERLEVVTLGADDPNHIREYRLSVSAKEEELVDSVRRLADGVEGKRVPGLVALWYKEHAYEPLLHADRTCRVTVQPAALNDDEARVVKGLASIPRSFPRCLNGRELFLIRNLTRGRGVSFFDDFHYYPDFILWLKNDEDQHVVFLDPKGLSRYGKREQNKVRLHTEIRNIESKVRESDPSIFLHSYVLSRTKPEDIGEEGLLRADWEREGVYFLSQPDCLQRVIAHALASRGGGGNGDGR